MNTNKTSRVVLVKRAEFRLNGRRMVVILNSAGQVELYWIDSDGIEMFAGYIQSQHDARWIKGARAALATSTTVDGQLWLSNICPSFLSAGSYAVAA